MEEFAEIYCPLQYHPRAQHFLSEYDYVRTIVCPDEKMRGLKPKPQRVCRFCKLQYGQVNFKKDAHVFSEFLGNKYLVSDFECSNCNGLFCTYESHLSYFIGPVRAFQKLYGREKDYKFKSPDKKTVAENYNEYGLENSFSISREDVADQTFEIDREAGRTLINFVKHSYTPLLVYKAILKMALSCLDEDEIKYYDLACKYLLTDSLDDNIRGAAKMLTYSVPPGKGYSTPFAVLYKKMNQEAKLSTHIFVLYFMNQVYQIAVPLNASDLHFYTDEEVEVLYAPPFFHDQKTADTMEIKEQYLDMSGKELVKAEKEVIGFGYNKDEYAKGAAYDPATNEITSGGFNHDAIAKIVFMPENASLKIPLDK
jgi:hypothetical protein